MHRSRLSTFVIDCEDTDPAAAAEFWSVALGRKVSTAGADDPKYRTLEMRDDEPVVLFLLERVLTWIREQL